MLYPARVSYGQRSSMVRALRVPNQQVLGDEHLMDPRCVPLCNSFPPRVNTSQYRKTLMRLQSIPDNVPRPRP